MGRRFLNESKSARQTKVPKLARNGSDVYITMARMESRDALGTCMTMCPEAERNLRERELLIHPFEVFEGTENCKCPRGDPDKMVKGYSRPAAGRVDPSPTDLRPPSVLMKTVKYLIEKIVPRENCRWTDVYEFVSDRLRAIRQDLIIQCICGPVLIKILENTVLFHIYAGYRLCTEPLEVFVPTLNNNQVQESLKWLLSQYQESDSCHGNRDLFESIYLLYNLGNSDALQHYLQLDRSLRLSPLLQTAYKISTAYLLGDYVKTYRLMYNLTSIHCQLAAHKHFVELKRFALRVMSAGYSSKNLRYPVSKLTELLPFNSHQEAINLSRNCGLSVLDGKVQFLRTAFVSDVEIKPCHAVFIDKSLKSTPLQGLFLEHSDQEKRESSPNRIKMTLPKKFSRLKIGNE